MIQQTSMLCISREALKKNLNFIRKAIGKKPQISLVVKGNAYGHGLSVYIPLAEELGMNHFSVFSDFEAQQVKKQSHKNSKIMIMGMLDNKNMSWVIQNDIEFFVFDIDRLKHAIKTAQKLKKKAQIHLEIETGLNRTGLDTADLETAIKLILENDEFVDVEGLCTHFAGAESISNYYRIHKQIKKFKKIESWIHEQGVHPKKRHTACSAASISYPQTRMDMVRIGIMQYGFWPTNETYISYINERKNKTNPLTPILSWESKIMNVKEVSAGEFIGYGDSFLTNEKMKIAIVPVGYTNGYSRTLSNKSTILVKGKRVSVIGSVNMNLLIINVSQVPDIKKGDKVTLVGTQEDNTISFASFREQKDALNYEILARLPENIPRKIVE
jgi:alanine racemase